MRLPYVCDLEDLLQAHEDQAVHATREAEVYRRLLLLTLTFWEADRTKLLRAEQQVRELMGFSTPQEDLA